jgi:hypothetical protein
MNAAFAIERVARQKRKAVQSHQRQGSDFGPTKSTRPIQPWMQVHCPEPDYYHEAMLLPCLEIVTISISRGNSRQVALSLITCRAPNWDRKLEGRDFFRNLDKGTGDMT